MRRPRESTRGQRNNPYSILFLALPFLVGGIVLLLRTEPMNIIAGHAYRSGQGTYAGVMSPEMEHCFGAVGVLIGANIVGFYAYLCRQIGKEPLPREDAEEGETGEQ